ncbi:MAG: hypothetical protein ACU85V_03585 [Gammaproteobacteria bacterium]
MHAGPCLTMDLPDLFNNPGTLHVAAGENVFDERGLASAGLRPVDGSIPGRNRRATAARRACPPSLR